MRTTRLLIACLAGASLVLLPVIAWAESGTTTPPAKTTTSKAAKAAAKAAAKPTTPAAPTPVSPPPALPGDSLLPPASPIPATPAAPTKTAPALPAAPAAPVMPGIPSLTETPAPGTPKVGGTAPAAPVKEGETAVPKSFPYQGFINADLVNVRCGAGLYYYPVAGLSKNAEVTVEGESGSWLAIKPVEGVFGLMNRTDLALTPGAKTATVSTASARVYCSSRAAKRHWDVMDTLKQGDTVPVLGEEGDMIRVAPPAGARLYLVGQYVTAGSNPNLPPALANLEIPKVDPLIEEYRKADAAFSAEQNKEIGTWNFKDIAAEYQEIGDKADKAYIKKAVRERLALIADLEKRQVDFLKVRALGENLNRRLAELKAEEANKQATATAEQKAAKPEFVALGMVARMESLENVDYPIKFKLIDQQGRPLVVLKSTAFDLGKYVGKVVGIRGTKTYLKDWRIYLVTVDELEVQE
jgi:uncharacterized protein YgiM (DUF1202 family)